MRALEFLVIVHFMCVARKLSVKAGIYYAIWAVSYTHLDVYKRQALIGCQGVEEFAEILPGVLHMGVAPEEVKEITYQAAAYLGIGRVRPFLTVVNRVFRQQEIPLPTKGQTTVERRERKEKGEMCIRDSISTAPFLCTFAIISI